MLRYFLLSLGAQFRRERALTALTVLGVALGVASVSSIQIINLNAIGAFKAGLDAISGDADLSVVGVGPAFDERLYPRVLQTAGVHAAWPLFRLPVTMAGRADYFMEVLGVDLFSPQDLPWKGARAESVAPLSTPGWTAVSPQLAQAWGWSRGSKFDVTSGSRRATLTVGGIVDFSRRSPQASRKILVMDIAQAQELFDGAGRLHEIDVQVAKGADVPQVAAALRRALGPGVSVLTPGQRQEAAEGLLSAFQLNLTALSMISLFVGLFLVFASAQASLLRRRGEFGVLRSLGATGSQLLALLLAQTAALGGLGIAIGLPLGYLGARLNMDTVSATVSNLYLLNEIETLRLTPGLFLSAVGIGLAGVLLGAALPLWEILRLQPLELLSITTLHEKLAAWARPFARAGIAVLTLTLAWYFAAGRAWAPSGFVLAVALILFLISAVPWLVRAVYGRLPLRAFDWRYSFKNLELRLQTSAPAIAAMVVAVCMLTGITFMIQSFRKTIEVWARKSIQADVYISTESWLQGRAQAGLDDALVRDLETRPEARAVDEQRYLFAQYQGHRVAVSGVRIGLPGAEARFPLVASDAKALDVFARERRGVMIGEPFARRSGVKPGGTLTLDGPEGPVALTVAGVYRDYATDWGTGVMDIDAMARAFGPGPLNNLALYLKPGVDAEAEVDRLKERYAGKPLVIRSNALLLQEVFRIFDQTFAVTRLLQAMSLTVAAFGISLTLLILARERAAETALYRSLGATRRQIFFFFLGKGFGMLLMGLALGVGGGVALALILIDAINPAYFGWTIPMSWPWRELAGQALTLTLAALAGGAYPALVASRTPAQELSRDEL